MPPLQQLSAALSPATQSALEGPVSTLALKLEPGEEPLWLGRVLVDAAPGAMLFTNARLMLARSDVLGHWEALDILNLAEHGLVLPRRFLLTIAGSADGGWYKREIRPGEPDSFIDLPWPSPALPFIAQHLVRSEELDLSWKEKAGIFLLPFLIVAVPIGLFVAALLLYTQLSSHGRGWAALVIAVGLLAAWVRGRVKRRHSNTSA